MDDDWDLQAVVRGCTVSASSSSTSTLGGGFTSSAVNTRDFSIESWFSSYVSESASGMLLFSAPDPYETRHSNVYGELQELYKPFFPDSHQIKAATSIFSPQTAPISPVVVSKQQTQPKQQHQHGSVNSNANSHTPRSKRRKNQLKRICQVPAEALSSDVWAWRKYGQKPIKGSPYPRGYYRCSSSKGCLARKQVERNRSDPGMFILTYTGEHNHPAPTHRNSLSGSTRQKTVSGSQTTAASDSDQPSPPKPTCSSPATSLDDELLPPTTNTESRDGKGTVEDDDEDDLGGFSDMAVNDDFFAGLEELDAPVTGDSLSDHFAMNFGLPWLPSNAAIAAGSL